MRANVIQVKRSQGRGEEPGVDADLLMVVVWFRYVNLNSDLLGVKLERRGMNGQLKKKITCETNLNYNSFKSAHKKIGVSLKKW